jgi:hypothetical protein
VALVVMLHFMKLHRGMLVNRLKSYCIGWLMVAFACPYDAANPRAVLLSKDHLAHVAIMHVIDTSTSASYCIL